MKSNSRDISADILKGIGILAMMVGHMPFSEGLLRHIIYSFHMPLFFLIAGYFFDASKTPRQIAVSGLKRLVLPYFVVQVLLILWGGVIWIAKNDSAMFYRFLCELLWTSEGVWHTQWGNVQTGAVWFLLAMFWARVIFAKLIHCRYCTLICTLISCFAMFIYQYIEVVSFVPTFLVQGLSALVFMAVGYKYNDYKSQLDVKWIVAACILWIGSIFISTIDMYSCYSIAYPIAAIGACSGTFVLYRVFQKIVEIENNFKWKSLSIATLKWIGTNSLLVLLVHHFERQSCITWNILSHLPVHLEGAQLDVFRIVVAILSTFIIYKISVTCQLKMSLAKDNKVCVNSNKIIR